MIRALSATVTIIVTLAVALVPGHASSVEVTPPAFGAHRWVRNPIIVSFSSSLNSPAPNIKEGTDVVAAVRRALESWSTIANIQFFETSSNAEAISAPTEGDGVNLITISPANGSLFENSEAPARTRVFHDAGGAIVEADIALNPAVSFSADGTPGTYDLESAFAHEVGHFLGLEHSAVIGATMQPRQARNGVYGLPALSGRSLSSDDVARARALYGPTTGTSISGRLTTNVLGRARNVYAAHVYAEDIATGNVVASSISSTSGQYRVDGLAAGVYRLFVQPLDGAIAAAEIGGSQMGAVETSPPFRSFIASNSKPSQSLNVSGDANLRLSFFVFSRSPTLTPRFIGMNSELSTAPLPLLAGERVTIYIAGEGIDQIALDGISISSPVIRIVPDSLRNDAFPAAYPVIAFDLIVGDSIPPGDYTIRLQSANGEVAFLPGAITIEPR
jgi:hypothetical protein